MSKNDGSFASIQTYPNSNEVTSDEIICKKRKSEKNVSFNETIVIYNVESYKEHNKQFTYNEEEGLAEFYKSLPFGHNTKLFGPFKQNFLRNTVINTNPNLRQNVDPDCCCIIM